VIPIPFRNFNGCHSPRPATPLPQRDSSPPYFAAARASETSCWCKHPAQGGALAEQTITLPGTDASNDAMPQNTH
jgi:hypothetical protein